VVSLWDKGGSEIVSALGFPPAQPGRRSSRRRHDEKRYAADAVEELVDEVEESVVRPVQILEYENERALVRERFEETSPCCERLAPAVGGGLAAAESGQNAQVRRDPVCVGRIFDHSPHRFPELALDRSSRIALENPGLRLHHLLERPEADAVAVGKRAALVPRGWLAGLRSRLPHLRDEPRLADARDPQDRHELG
jgi:hypothetical protein